MSTPFDYPPEPHIRRHGPRGYSDYGSYRPWLRDELSHPHYPSSDSLYQLQRAA